jgi:predicted RNA-binding Zn-ribbon protein involved in translation (DUF1610 family)
MENNETGPSTVAPIKGKKSAPRETFMGEICHSCHRGFKITKDYTVYKLTCPYCAKRVESNRIMKDLLHIK